MPYRPNIDPPAKPKNRSMQALTTPQKIYMENGTKMNFAIPCWYQEIRLPQKMNHISDEVCRHETWPSPETPEGRCLHLDSNLNCCSLHKPGPCNRCGVYLDMTKLIPIHLTSEGYTTITVSTSDSTNITASATIDTNNDWIIRLVIAANYSSITSEQEVKFAVYASRGTASKDLITKGRIVVMPELI